MLLKKIQLALTTMMLIILAIQPSNVNAQVGGAGGIIIGGDHSGNIDSITDVRISKDTFLIGYKATREKVKINLPEHALLAVAEWAERSNSGQLVFSADNFLFGTSSDGPYKLKQTAIDKRAEKAVQMITSQAIEQGLAETLGKAIAYYDQYVNDLLCGAFPNKDTSAQFLLIQSNKNIPQDVLKEMLEDQTRMQTYRKLFQHYPSAPFCVGEMSFNLSNANKSSPFQLQVQAKRWFLAYTWEREFVILDDEDLAAADLPYIALGKDIQSRWNDYRKAFKPIDELSSIMEAFIILRAIKKSKRSLYDRIIHDIHAANSLSAKQMNFTIRPTLEPKIDLRPILEESAWKDMVVSMVGEYVETIEHAEIFLFLKMANWEKERLAGLTVSYALPNHWQAGLERLQAMNPLLHTKTLLVKALHSSPNEALPVYKDFFSNLSTSENSFKKFALWGQSLNWFREYCNRLYPSTTQAHRELLAAQRKAFFDLLMVEMKYVVSRQTHLNHLKKARDLLNVVYGVRLLDLATNQWPSTDSEGNLDAPELLEFIKLVGELHWLCCQELKLREDHTKLLSHYRYINHLAHRIPLASKLLEPIRTRIYGIL